MNRQSTTGFIEEDWTDSEESAPMELDFRSKVMGRIIGPFRSILLSALAGMSSSGVIHVSIDDRRRTATRYDIYGTARVTRRITAREARRIALDILRNSEARRIKSAQEETRRALLWEDLE